MRRLRHEAGITQEALAEHAGVGVRTVRGLESGERVDPRFTTVRLLADALGLAPEEREELLAAASAHHAEPVAGQPGSVLDESLTDLAKQRAQRLRHGQCGDPLYRRWRDEHPVPVSVAPDPQESGPAAHTPEQSGGERPITIGKNSGIVNIGDHNVSVLFAEGASTEGALAKLVEQLVHAVRVGPPSVDHELANKADLLADKVHARLQNEWEQLRLRDPAPLPVHWQPAGPLDEITAGVQERAEFGWLMVLGREGSGKSVLALRFALTRLEAHPHAHRAPVPVIFSLGSWNPKTTPLRNWLISRLERDHPFLAAASPSGKTWAATLVGADYVLPILDGFDEIAIGLRKAALIALNSCALPLLVTSRRAEFEAATKETKVVPSATAIELIDLNLDDSVSYLQEATGTTLPTLPDSMDVAPQTGWAYVLSELRRPTHTPAGANLAAVLTTPLMVTLAQFVYESERDPSDLLDTEKFGTREALEKHLLGTFIPTAYKHFLSNEPAAREHRRLDPERAQYWLGYLAHHLTRLGTSDLEWWKLGYGLRRATRTLVTSLVICLAIGCVDGAVGVLFAPLGFKLVDGPVAGLFAGLMFGTLYWFKVAAKEASVALSGVRMKKADREGKARRRTLRRVAIGLLCGLVFGFGYGFVTPALTGVLWRIGLPAGLRLGLGYGVVYGLAFALGAGVTFGLLTFFETPIGIPSAVNPGALLRTSRRTVAAQLLVLAPTFGLLVGLGAELVVRPLSGVLWPLLWTPTAALKLGIISGLDAALGYVLSLTAWGQWVVFARIWLPLTGRLPWSLVTFVEDAHQRGVLSQAGAVYRFRHTGLQDHLSRVFSQRRHGQLRDVLAEQREAHRNEEDVEGSMMADPKRISPWMILSIAIVLLLLLSWISIRDILENLQIHGSLGPSDAPAVVTAVVSLATAVGALVGGTLTGLSKYVQARGQAYAEKTRADADMLRARADVRRAEAGLPPLETPPEGDTPPLQPNPSE
ncbi:hypothetical protein GCM10010341_15000 [Streptomyces noursei]|nr:hypothetical protein GCM10010341_15000 [Streptomyces noursei]